MNLFEKVNNIRKDLQEKTKFPGDESGAYKQAKDDLEARKGFKKNKSGGLKADERNPYVNRSVRKSRVDKLGGDIYDQPKFSQKKFDKSIGGAKKPTSAAPPGEFGPGDTKGQMNVKGMEKKAFKKTQPKDVKLPKSFRDFDRNLQDYKDKDKATMRTGKSSSKVKVSGEKNLSRQDVGMAPPDKPKTKGVKQSEVSKQAKDFTKNINQKRQTTTPSKSDVERIKQNKIDTKKADQFKKTAAYKNIAQGKDSKGNYLSKEQRKANFIKQTKQNKAIKNKTIKRNKNFGTSKTATGNNKVTTGMGRGSGTRVTTNKDFAKDFKNTSKVNRPANYGTASYYRSQGKDAFDLRKNPLPQGKPGTRTGEPVLPKFSKKSGVTNPSFMKKVMPKMRKAATPAAKAFSKAGPVGKLAAGVLAGGALIYGANQVRKAFAGAGKPKAPPVVKGSALRYTSGPKKGQKKYFDIKTMKKNYFTDSDLRDAGFNDKADKKLQQKLRSTK